MSRLIGMIVRVAMWGGFGFVLGFVVVMAYEMLFTGGAMTFKSPNAFTAATIGAAVGGVIGFFRRN